MANFVKELIKYFHPDNVDTGDGEKFIKLKNQIENDKLEFIVNLSLRDAICGKTLIIGNEEFEIKPCETLNPKLICKSYKAKDGTQFYLRFKIENKDEKENLEVMSINGHVSLVKIIEINAFDAFFGGKRINFTLYGKEKHFDLKLFTKLNNYDKILTNINLGTKLYVKFVIKETENDIKFINALRELYKDCKEYVE